MSKLNLVGLPNRPDGKPCKSRYTDATFVSLSWQWADGTQVATYDFGCDEYEFRDTYKQISAIADIIPVRAPLVSH